LIAIGRDPNLAAVTKAMDAIKAIAGSILLSDM